MTKQPLELTVPFPCVDWTPMPRNEVPAGSLMLTMLLSTRAVYAGPVLASGVETNRASAKPFAGSLCVLIVFPEMRRFAVDACPTVLVKKAMRERLLGYGPPAAP